MALIGPCAEEAINGCTDTVQNDVQEQPESLVSSLVATAGFEVLVHREMFAMCKSTIRPHCDAILGNLHCRRTPGHLKCSHCTDDC